MKQAFARWQHIKAARIPVCLAAVLLALALTGCGGGSNSYGGSWNADSYREAAYEEPAYGYADYEDDEFMAGMDVNTAYYGGDSKASVSVQRTASTTAPGAAPEEGDNPSLPRKLIRRASLEMETTEFDQSASALSDLVDSMGGYFSNASSGDQGGSRKRADYTIRIPAKRFNDFLAAVGDICHETWRDVTQEDISERYYDTQGRLRTQTTKLHRLQELLTQAADMEDIITIQSAISETEERIEELQGTLSHWDNQVDYATINLSLSEVYRLSNDPPAQKTYADRLGFAFVDGVKDFCEWVGDLIISLAYSWLWWLLLVLVVLGILRLRRSQWWEKKRAERAARKAARESRAAQAPRFPQVPHFYPHASQGEPQGHTPTPPEEEKTQEKEEK